MREINGQTVITSLAGDVGSPSFIGSEGTLICERQRVMV